MPCRRLPTQLLSYYAGRTKRITLGTAVIVLPWHDPIRVAEQIALLDVMSGGRCLFGFGRGAASVEYAGFRIPMEEARPRFVEAAKIIVAALSNESFEWEGEFFKIPRTSIRPAADLASRAPLLRVIREPGVRGDHGEARLRRAGHHARTSGRRPPRTSSGTRSCR